MDKYDVIVIGAGPAGYVAAIRCAQQGLHTACIDNWSVDAKPSLGGTCLNVGCIPSKALLESSELYHKAKDELQQHGIATQQVSLELDTMMQRKQQLVSELTGGIHSLFKANKVSFIHGSGKLLANKHVEVQSTNDTQTISAEHIILAPGSRPAELAQLPFTDDLIVDSSQALQFEQVPEKLAIVGAGVIGLELGSVWNRLGSEVHLLEYATKLLPVADSQIAKQMQALLHKQGLNFSFGANINAYDINENQVTLHYNHNNKEHSEAFDKVFVAAGRIPNTEYISSEDSGIQLTERGFIDVDTQCRTSVDGVYAIGDAVRGPMLAHKGSEEGIMVAELINGQYGHVNYETVPIIIYTDPEIAWCGQTEQSLQERGIEYNIGQFPFAINGRAKSAASTNGFIKILADKKTDRILGVHMLGPNVSELIGQAVIAMEFQASSEDLALTMFAHPTLSEVLHEAALDTCGKAIHKIGK